MKSAVNLLANAKQGIKLSAVKLAVRSRKSGIISHLTETLSRWGESFRFPLVSIESAYFPSQLSEPHAINRALGLPSCTRKQRCTNSHTMKTILTQKKFQSRKIIPSSQVWLLRRDLLLNYASCRRLYDSLGVSSDLNIAPARWLLPQHRH